MADLLVTDSVGNIDEYPGGSFEIDDGGNLTVEAQVVMLNMESGEKGWTRRLMAVYASGAWRIARYVLE